MWQCVCVGRNHEKWHFRIANFISAFPSEWSEWQQVNNKLPQSGSCIYHSLLLVRGSRADNVLRNAQSEKEGMCLNRVGTGKSGGGEWGVGSGLWEVASEEWGRLK